MTSARLFIGCRSSQEPLFVKSRDFFILLLWFFVQLPVAITEPGSATTIATVLATEQATIVNIMLTKTNEIQ